MKTLSILIIGVAVILTGCETTTTLAIETYQKDQGLPVDGRADTGLWEHVKRR